MSQTIETELDLFVIRNSNLYVSTYAFFDSESEVFDTPFFCHNDLHAKRHFHIVVKKDGSIIHEYKDNFDLYRLGYFNKESGGFVSDLEMIHEGKKITIEGDNK